MIISVHMPKSGGKSFRQLLETHFKRGYLQDHDYPIHDSPEVRHRKVERTLKWNRRTSNVLLKFRKVECIHGHFLPYKYDNLYQMGDSTFVTWFRDPVERLLSHYHFWKQYHEIMVQKPLMLTFLKENWTFEEFAFSEEIRNIYSLYLWNFPVERFKFIGITEHFEEDLLFFAQEYLGVSNAVVPKKNINKKSKEKMEIDPGLKKEIQQFHSDDYKLYQYALSKRLERTDQKR